MSANTGADLVCFGELLWDVLPHRKVAGGAPFNIVNRANALGIHAEVISSVGKDALGDDLIALVKDKGNPIGYIQRHPNLPTSTVQITVGESGEPHYVILAPVAWDDIRLTPEMVDLVRNSKSFVYSSLGLRDQRSREVLFDLLDFANLKVCDVNLRQGHYSEETILRMIRKADILRMNEYELELVSRLESLDVGDKKKAMATLAERYKLDSVIATLGKAGAISYAKGNFYKQPVFKVDVKDTVGSGDAFLAAYMVKKLKGASEENCLRYGCAIGALTASKDGGTPSISRSEISELLSLV